jgi:hypothetical protein
MTIDEQTAAVKQLQAGEARAQYQAGVILDEVRDTKSYKEKGLKNFNAYLLLELPQMERSWAYVLMSVAENFTEQHAADYGIKPLNTLQKLAREVFTDRKPAELLIGEQSFTDADGERHVLDFQKDRTVSTLKGLLAAARFRRDHAIRREPSPDLQPIAFALASTAESLPSLKYALHETRDGLKVELQGKPADLTAAFDRLAALTD